MMWTGELRLAQEDGALPITMAAGGAPGERGVSVLRVRLRDGAHLSGTTQQHLICLASEVCVERHMAGRALRYETPAGWLITSSAPPFRRQSVNTRWPPNSPRQTPSSLDTPLLSAANRCLPTRFDGRGERLRLNTEAFSV
jgi:hypothetical protein